MRPCACAWSYGTVHMAPQNYVFVVCEFGVVAEQPNDGTGGMFPCCCFQQDHPQSLSTTFPTHITRCVGSSMQPPEGSSHKCLVCVCCRRLLPRSPMEKPLWESCVGVRLGLIGGSSESLLEGDVGALLRSSRVGWGSRVSKPVWHQQMISMTH
jgi:hypothetical protein